MLKKSGNKDLGFYIATVFLALSFLLYALMFDNVLITSPGMEPGLKDGDYVLVSNTKYLLSVPFVGKLTKLGKPERGDLIFFETKAQGDDGEKVSSILRVVGLPGETLEIINKGVFIENKPFKEPYTTFDDSKIYPPGISVRDNLGPFVIPDNSYFLMGDRRDITTDCRFFGFVAAEEIKGEVLFIYWSTNPDNGVFRGIRWERIGSQHFMTKLQVVKKF